MPGLDVSPADVAAYALDAPTVTADQILEARDWAEPLLERAGVVLAEGSRELRAARRAVMNYALHLRTSTRASSLRTTGTAQAVTQVRRKIGELETERRYADPTDTAAGVLVSAGEYLSRAWQGLYDAGLPRPTRVAGVSR